MAMDLQSIHHVALIVSDYERSKKFYTQVLGLKIITETYREARDSWKLDLTLPDGGQLELFTMPGAPARLSYPEALGLRHLAFAVGNVDGAVKELTEKGISCEPVRLDELTGRRFTFFADPDGLPLELYEVA
jgi:glyoxylase I family protein